KAPRFKGTGGVLLAGLLVRGTFATDYPSAVTVIAAAVLAALVARPWWRIFAFAVGVAVPVALCFLYPFASRGFALGAPHAAALFESFFSLQRGLFVLAPWLLAAFPGFYW